MSSVSPELCALIQLRFRAPPTGPICSRALLGLDGHPSIEDLMTTIHALAMFLILQLMFPQEDS